MRLVILTSNYPMPSRPHYGVFVRELVHAFARLDCECVVIRPVSVFSRRHGALPPFHTSEAVRAGRRVSVFSPRYISASSRKVGGFHTERLSQRNFERAVRRVWSRLPWRPDAVYGHFLYPAGAVAVRVGWQHSLPSVVAVGESTVADWLEKFGAERCVQDFSGVTGVVAVSESNRRFCRHILGVPETHVRVFPNGVDTDLFRPRDRREMRVRHGLPQARFLVAFVGHFDERKGPHRLLAALADVPDVGFLFIGSGPARLRHPNIVFQGVLEHTRVAEMLAAADVFVLPTLAEGCCNAILEALACGLPVVTSRGAFNDEILTDQVALRVDPLSPNEIRSVVLRLRSEPTLRARMADAARVHAQRFDLARRAQGILAWMRERGRRNGSQLGSTSTVRVENHLGQNDFSRNGGPPKSVQAE